MKRFSYLLCLLLAGGTIITVCIYRSGCNKEPMPLNPSFPDPQTLVNKVKLQEQKFKKQMDSLQAANQQMDSRLSVSAKALKAAKRKTGLLEWKVKELIKSKTAEDTTQKLTACDTLAEKVTDLLEADREKDSLCELVISISEAKLQNRDSVIAVQGLQYQALKTIFENSINGQQVLLSEIKKYKQRVRKEKFKKNMLTGGIIILTGILINKTIR